MAMAGRGWGEQQLTMCKGETGVITVCCTMHSAKSVMIICPRQLLGCTLTLSD